MKTMSKVIKLSVVVVFLLLLTDFAHPGQVGEHVNLAAFRTTQAITIDGVLNEEVWSNPGVEEYFISLSPSFGKKLDYKTGIWMAYDNKNLYFAFKCYDSEPDRIKTSLAPRDKIIDDDWIGVMIDSMGKKETAYEFYVNPSGIQLDYMTASIAGGGDISPDFVWESAAKITGEGYQVEIRVPLKSIRHKTGKEVEMGVLFRRNISRFGIYAAWPEVKAGQSEFIAMDRVVVKGLKTTRKLELLPSFTFSSSKEKETQDTWAKSETTKDIGIYLKYGLSSSITAEVTVNPDFSQVESDAYQVEVNQRYPIFYSEKRPFFMEGTDLFQFGTIFFGHLVQAVDTRKIVEPGWAAKLSGSSGKTSFALLAAEDSAFGKGSRDEPINPFYEGKNAIYGIGRLKYNLGGEKNIGILYSGRHFSGGRNDVIGADLFYRPLKNIRLNLAYLHSITNENETDTRVGSGINAMMYHVTKHYSINAAYERYDDDFFMASAFQNRINLSRFWAFSRYRFYTKIKKMPWLLQFSPFVLYSRLHDLGTKMDDWWVSVGFNLVFTHRGYFEFEWREGKEAWAGHLFDQDYINTYGIVQLFKWLYMDFLFKTGDQIYYDVQEPFFGHGLTFMVNLNLQPSKRLNLGINYTHTHFNRVNTNERIYNVDIYNLIGTYQFNKYFFIRGVLRYDNYEQKLLTDLLASFTLIPGSVVHLGYGSLYRQREWVTGQWQPGQAGSLSNVKNNLFFKVSYLWRIQ